MVLAQGLTSPPYFTLFLHYFHHCWLGLGPRPDFILLFCIIFFIVGLVLAPGRGLSHFFHIFMGFGDDFSGVGISLGQFNPHQAGPKRHCQNLWFLMGHCAFLGFFLGFSGNSGLCTGFSLKLWGYLRFLGPVELLSHKQPP